jgi:hypothetical protein
MRAVRIVLADSPDVMGSIGREGLLSERMGAGAVDAPDVDVTVVPGVRPDLFAQRVTATSKPAIEVPDGLEGWFASMFDPIPIPDNTVLIVMSMTAALDTEYLRHSQHGFVVSAPKEISNDVREWLDANFEAAPLDLPAMTKAIDDLANLNDVETEIVVYNLSTYFPEEPNYKAGDLNRASLAANQLDLVVDKAAQDTGIYVVDVDRIIAEYGAAEGVLSGHQFSDEVDSVVAEEALSLILELPGINEIFGTEVMHLGVPRYDRRTETGVLVEWHVEAPSRVEAGDSLFDVRYDDIAWKLNIDPTRKTGRSLRLSVVASRDCYLKEIVVHPGEPISAGSKVGVVTLGPDSEYGDFEHTSRFPVGIKMVER